MILRITRRFRQVSSSWQRQARIIHLTVPHPVLKPLALPDAHAIGPTGCSRHWIDGRYMKQQGFEQRAIEQQVPQIASMRNRNKAGIRFGEPRFSNSRHAKMRSFNTCPRSLHR